MILFLEKRRAHISFKLLTVFLILSFLLSSVVYFNQPSSKSYADFLPAPGQMLHLSPAFVPTLLRGVTIYPDDPFRFDFIIEDSDEKQGDDQFKKESQQLIKYFLASLTIPEDDIWVNLSPYEQNRVTPYNLGITELGKSLLSQDYILKQLLASLMHPENPTGKKFWRRVYEKAYKLYGTTNIPINSFNKVWIMPAKAVVETKDSTAYVAEGRLKVLLEEDYLALKENVAQKNRDLGKISKDEAKALNSLSSSVVKEIILPELEKEINQGKNFAQLRQVYNALILAVWFKQKLKQHILSQIYVDKKKVKGVDLEDREVREKIYRQYVAAYKKGVYDYVKTDYDISLQKEISRRYYGGGFALPGKEEEWVVTRKVDEFSQNPNRKSRNVEVALASSTVAQQPFVGRSERERGRVWSWPKITTQSKKELHELLFNYIREKVVHLSEVQWSEVMGWKEPKPPLANPSGWKGIKQEIEIDEYGNVVLYRYSDYEEDFVKSGKEVSREELQDTSDHHGGGAGIPTAFDAQVNQGSGELLGVYKIPVDKFIEYHQAEELIFGNIGEREVVLSPHIAKQYFDSYKKKASSAGKGGEKSGQASSAVYQKEDIDRAALEQVKADVAGLTHLMAIALGVNIRKGSIERVELVTGEEKNSKYAEPSDTIEIHSRDIDDGNTYGEEIMHKLRFAALKKVMSVVQRVISNLWRKSLGLEDQIAVNEFFGRLGEDYARNLAGHTAYARLFENSGRREVAKDGFSLDLAEQVYREEVSKENITDGESLTELMKMVEPILKRDNYFGHAKGYVAAELFMQQNPRWMEIVPQLLRMSERRIFDRYINIASVTSWMEKDKEMSSSGQQPSAGKGEEESRRAASSGLTSPEQILKELKASREDRLVSIGPGLPNSQFGSIWEKAFLDRGGKVRVYQPDTKINQAWQQYSNSNSDRIEVIPPDKARFGSNGSNNGKSRFVAAMSIFSDPTFFNHSHYDPKRNENVYALTSKGEDLISAVSKELDEGEYFIYGRYLPAETMGGYTDAQEPWRAKEGLRVLGDKLAERGLALTKKHEGRDGDTPNESHAWEVYQVTSSSTITIEQASAKDRSKIIALLKSDFKNHFKNPRHAPSDDIIAIAVNRAFMAEDPEGVFLVARKDNDIVGCVKVMQDSYQDWQLYWFAVRNDMRQQGIGRSLLQSAVNHLQQTTRAKYAVTIDSSGGITCNIAKGLGFIYDGFDKKGNLRYRLKLTSSSSSQPSESGSSASSSSTESYSDTPEIINANHSRSIEYESGRPIRLALSLPNDIRSNHEILSESGIEQRIISEAVDLLEIVHSNDLPDALKDSNIVKAHPDEFFIFSPWTNKIELLPDGKLIFVGRAPDSHYRVNQPLISATHLAVRRKGNRVILLDAESNSNTAILPSTSSSSSQPMHKAAEGRVGSTKGNQDLGGIDLNPASLDLEVRGGSIDLPQFKIPFDLQTFEGFTFRILKIEPFKQPQISQR